MYKLHTHCRACNYGNPVASGIKSAPSEKLIPVLDLGVQPLANDFQDEVGEHAGFAPLKVMFCPRCSLAQLSVVVPPKILYSNYNYVTSPSSMMRDHFEKLWSDMLSEGEIKSVLEIGSNTGDFLSFCSSRGAERVVGIDPAENLCKIAISKAVPSIPEMFNYESAVKANALLLGADAVVARHVFCHIDDWHDFVECLKSVGGKETIYVIEAPYTPDTIAMNSWDQIYHEHLNYLTIKSMRALLSGTGLHIHKVNRYSIHGGTVAIVLRRDESSVAPDVRDWVKTAEENFGEETWRSLAKRASTQQVRLRDCIEGIVDQGKTVAGFGASAKSTVWINAAGLTRRHIRFICDSTPQKQYKFSPGSEIPIVDEGALIRDLPDFAVCFAWNFMPEVLKNQSLYIKNGGRFIVPVPEISIVP